MKRRSFLAGLLGLASAPAVAAGFDDCDLLDEEVDEALDSNPLQQRDFGKMDPVVVAINGRAWCFKRGVRHDAPAPVRQLLAASDYPHLKHPDGTIEFPL